MRNAYDGDVDGNAGSRNDAGMARLTLDEVKEIGTAAIRRVIGDSFTDSDFKIVFDLDDQPEYSFRLQFSTAKSWQNASTHISEITEAVMEDLARHGDDSFPFVWLLSDGSWILGRDVAAE